MSGGHPVLVAIIVMVSFKHGYSSCDRSSDGEMLSAIADRFSNPYITYSPNEPDKKKAEQFRVLFDLYTRSNPQKPETFTLDMPGRMFRRLVPSKKTVVLVHGWKTNGHKKLAVDLRKAYVRKYDCNFIMVDWSYASVHFYIRARDKVHFIGQVVAEFINKLIKDVKVPIPQIHLVGFSLGGHIAGTAGRYLKGILHRITGLDPAGPGFTAQSIDRLGVDSAQFVVVLHTSLLGYQYSLGHVDIYVNAANFQPGCLFKDISGKCSHSRAYAYFAESLMYTSNFEATLCAHWSEYKAGRCKGKATVFLGEDMNPSTRGDYMLATNTEPPYGLGPEK